MSVRVTFGFNPTGTGDRRFAFTNSFWLPNQSSTDLSQNDTVCVNLANRLLAMMASNVNLISVRMSYFTVDPGTGRPIASRQRNRILVPGQTNMSNAVSISTLSYQGAYSLLWSDQAKGCVQCAIDGLIGAPGSQIKGNSTMYLAGIPDDLIKLGSGGTLSFASIPGWSDAWQAFLSQLYKDQWGFLGLQRPPTKGPANIIRWTQEAPGTQLRLMYTLSQANQFGSPGDKVHVRRVRMTVPRAPTPNGIWRIDAVAGPDASNNYTYTLQNTSGFVATQIATPGTVESVTQGFYMYAGTGQPLRATTRKRGATYGAARGKSRPRPRQLA